MALTIIIADEESSVAGFISWHRLATALFPAGGEISLNEKVTRFEIGTRGINFFVTQTKPKT